jgi:RNA polymerase sigma-70 factor (ECF subfamily)
VEQGQRAELRRLMERLADGDRSAVAPAFAALWPTLRAFAVRCAGAEGEDAAQSALLRIFASASEYDARRDALAWALGIAAWECRTLRRKRERRREESALALDHHPAETSSPEEAVLQRDLREAAESVLGTLRPIDIETIAAAAGGERSPGATFRKRLERALLRFRLAWRTRHGE